jgi:hypothetical protein
LGISILATVVRIFCNVGSFGNVAAVTASSNAICTQDRSRLGATARKAHPLFSRWIAVAKYLAPVEWHSNEREETLAG